MLRLRLLFVSVLAAVSTAGPARAAAPPRILIDATQGQPAPGDLGFPAGGADPSGRVLSANDGDHVAVMDLSG